MSSGIEVMICHAENVSRHLERVREDLTELRLKERLVAEEPVTSVANGSSLSGKTLFFPKLTLLDKTRQCFIWSLIQSYVIG